MTTIHRLAPANDILRRHSATDAESRPVHRLARAYDDVLAAACRGDDLPRQAFAAWLDPFWQDIAPPEPSLPPAAVSRLGGGYRGIRWHETPAALLGYVPGSHGCYRIPLAAVAPSLLAAA
jgi:hypothetical protein